MSQHQVSALGPQDSLQIGTPVASQQISIPNITPALNSATQCTISVINSCSNFYCQLTANSEPFDSIMNDLYSFYEEGRGVPLSALTIGSYCAAPFTDGSWYRGTISALSGQDAAIHYIDYGNTDTVPLSNLYLLSIQAYSVQRCLMKQFSIKLLRALALSSSQVVAICPSHN